MTSASAGSPLPGVGALVINFNTAALTARCVESLAGQPGLRHVLVLDNGSDPGDLARLRASMPPAVELLELDSNLGFAGGSNAGIAQLLADPAIDAVLLLNSDAMAEPGLVAALAAALDPERGVDLVGAPMYKPGAGRTLDSLGIAFYSSCIASNRIDPADPLFGPTGGCALYSRRLLAELQEAHGHIFDPDFFCYAEDTDVAGRALLLGYRPRMIESPGAMHEGQASSGGGFSRFVLYHGIRNSVWTMLKVVPGPVLLRYLPRIVLLHAGIVLRHARRGELGTVASLYRDAALGSRRMLVRRRLVQRTRRVTPQQFRAFVSPKFYDGGLLRNAVLELMGRGERRQER